MSYRSLFFIFILSIGSQLTAQNDLSSLLLQNSWQSLNTNPAKQPKGIIVNLPGVYSNSWITNVTFDDLVKEENGSNVLDIDNAISKLGAQNFIRQDVDIETLGVGFRAGKLGISLGHRVRFLSLLDYPKTLAQLTWQGNAQFIGQVIDFGPSFDLTAYHEWALGVSYQISDNINIGGRVKRLSGISNINTERSKLSLSTNDDVYQLDLDADFLVNSAGVLSYNGLDDIGISTNFGNLTTDEIFGKNTGLAIDLGIAVQLGKIYLSASALDLGAEITWKENVSNYALNGNYVFEGLDVAQEIFDNQESFSSVTDTLKATYNVVETNNSYSTKLGGKFYFSGQYELSEQLQVGLIAFTDDYQDVQSSALALSGSMQISSLLRVGGFYGLRNKRADNLGVNASLYTGLFNVHVATDNILSAFNPNKSHLANFRLGLNLMFGQEKDKVESNGGSQFY